MASKNELACVYASLILVDDDIAVTGEKLQTILKAANVEIEPYWPGLFAKSLEGMNPKDLITNVGSGVGTAAPGGVVAAAVAEAAPSAVEAPKKEEKKEESEESDDDMGFGLFD